MSSLHDHYKAMGDLNRTFARHERRLAVAMTLAAVVAASMTWWQWPFLVLSSLAVGQAISSLRLSRRFLRDAADADGNAERWATETAPGSPASDTGAE